MRKGNCVHDIGHHHNTHCAAGVCYRDVLTEPNRIEGSAFRYACTQDWSWCRSPLTPSQQAEFEKRGSCDKYQEPTAEQITAHKAKMELHMRQFEMTLPIIARIKKEHRGQSWRGVEECPVCKGKLHMTHAAVNGHVWGKCETKDCLSWLE